MDKAISQWLSCSNEREPWGARFTQQILKSYVVYGSLLLLPSKAFDDLVWSRADEETAAEELNQLYRHIAHHLKVTHIGTNRPIPLHQKDSASENILRSPVNFTPLYGDFGPASCHDPPTREDFDTAYWTTAKQNGIYQTWAPRWTMFSRGNISEKARLLSLSTVLSAVEHGREDGRGCTAVDMYAGIGYFAFSYLKAGVSKVLCFDLNPWSIEGLMRGANSNKWEARQIRQDDHLDEIVRNEDVRLLAFNMSNTFAHDYVRRMAPTLPPIRHINCGLLPTSRGSWEVATACIDVQLGGWIHVHENFAIEEIGQRANEVREEIQQIVERQAVDGRRNVVVEHVNRLKSYAPGVIHCVIDIYIPPYSAS